MLSFLILNPLIHLYIYELYLIFVVHPQQVLWSFFLSNQYHHLQNKLLEAMAMKIPSITSSLANQALNASHGEEILVGNNAEELAELIIQVLEEDKLAAKLAESGYRFVHKNYNWSAATRVLEKIMVYFS